MTATDDLVDLSWFLEDEDETEETAQERQEFVVTEPKSIDTSFAEKPKETPRAKKYRLKVKKALQFLMRNTIENPKTVADSAALIQYGPKLSEAIGELADYDERVRNAIDFVTEDGIANPWFTVAFASIPLFAQVIRNHEGALLGREVKPSIRLGKKRRLTLPFNFRIKLTFVRRVSEPPNELMNRVFTNPGLIDALKAQDIRVAWSRQSQNGRM